MVVLDTDHVSLLEREDSPASQRLRTRLSVLDGSLRANALTHDATRLSKNLSDFRKVPGLKVADWTLSSEQI
jgi:predicted nucleic acid-binding protein